MTHVITISNQFSWKTFSSVEVAMFRLQSFYLRILCELFGIHSWQVLIQSWELSEIKSLRDYKKLKVSNVVCEFCQNRCSNLETEFTASELSTYNHEVERSYEREIQMRHNESSKRKANQGS